MYICKQKKSLTAFETVFQSVSEKRNGWPDKKSKQPPPTPTVSMVHNQESMNNA